MAGKNASPERQPGFPWLLSRFLVQVFVLGLAVPLMLITMLGRWLPEFIVGPIAGASVLAYFYGSSRWLKWSAERLETPSARARFRRNSRRHS